MPSLKEELMEREKKSGSFLVGLVGAGQMGTGLISQIELMFGLKIAAVADIQPTRAKGAYREAGIQEKEIHWIEDDIEKADQILREGGRIATHSSQFLASIGSLDAIVECTGIPNVGAVICEQAINANKPIINMNVETDATIGYYLTKKAQEKNVIYSLIAGDEPGSIKEIYDFADALGFDIYAIGKGKNNPLDRTATPVSLAQQAEKKDMSTKMLCSFVDGTKTMVELTAIANGTGFMPEVRGGYGPKCSVEELPQKFIPKSSGGLFNTNQVVDYAIGPAPGVFVIITTDQPKIKKDLNYLGLSGYGNYWCLYRPYHLANIEAPITIANVLLHNKETLNTPNKPVAETIAMAKKDLHPGDVIDCLGGYTVYGMVEKASVAYEQNLVPLGCTIDGVVKKRVDAGEPLHYDDIELDETKRIVKLRRFQDKLVNGK